MTILPVPTKIYTLLETNSCCSFYTSLNIGGSVDSSRSAEKYDGTLNLSKFNFIGGVNLGG
jgi:hypothetical protein